MFALLKRFVFWVFNVMELRNRTTGKLHFRRWRVIDTAQWRFFVHEIYEADADKHRHNHPWDFTSWVIWGGYVEQTEDGEHVVLRGTVNRKSRDKFHKVLRLIRGGPSISLFVARGDYVPWGYMTEQGFVLKDEYTRLKHEGHWG